MQGIERPIEHLDVDYSVRAPGRDERGDRLTEIVRTNELERIDVTRRVTQQFAVITVARLDGLHGRGA